MAPGVVGSLSIVGSLTSSGVINLELGGAGSFDQIVSSGGTVTLGGTLNVVLINAFAPQPGQSFTILTSALSRAGTFGSVNLPAGTSVQYNANSVVITDP